LDDQLYAEITLNIAMDHHIFNEDGAKLTVWQQVTQPASNELIAQYQTLEWLVKDVTKNCIMLDRTEDLNPTVAGGPLLTLNEESTMVVMCSIQDYYPHLDRFRLNTEQQCTHDIIINHLKMTLAG
jgi:hypothetical protein